MLFVVFRNLYLYTLQLFLENKIEYENSYDNNDSLGESNVCQTKEDLLILILTSSSPP